MSTPPTDALRYVRDEQVDARSRRRGLARGPVAWVRERPVLGPAQHRS